MKQTADALMRAPTDLSNFLSCRHLSALDLRAARGELKRPVRHDEVLNDLRERGRAHEQVYLAHLLAQGLHVAGDVEGSTNEATLAAMRSCCVDGPGRRSTLYRYLSRPDG